jgi:hypothetical protein
VKAKMRSRLQTSLVNSARRTSNKLADEYSLHRIETVMQRLESSSLTELPASQQSLIPDGQPMIVGIAVTETKAREARL